MNIINVYNVRVERKGKIIYINFEDEKISIEKTNLKINIKNNDDIVYEGKENLFDEYVSNKYKYDTNLENNGSYIIEDENIPNDNLVCYFVIDENNILPFNIPKDTASPGKIEDLNAESYEKYIELKWNDPEDYDWYGTKIYRWENEEPSFSCEENNIILNGNYKLIVDYNERNLYSDGYLDFDIVTNNVYYYKAFTYDYDNNYNIECNIDSNVKNDTTEPKNIEINEVTLNDNKIILDVNFDALNDINAFKICKQDYYVNNMFEDNRFLEVGKIGNQYYIYDIDKIIELFNQRTDLSSNFLDDFYQIKEPIFSLDNFSILKRVYDELGTDLIFDSNVTLEDINIENGKTYYYKVFTYSLNEIINVSESKNVYVDIEKPIYATIDDNIIDDDTEDNPETDYDNDNNVGIEDKLSYYCDKENAYIKFWDQNYVINLYNGDNLLKENIEYNQYKYDYCFIDNNESNEYVIKYENKISDDNKYSTILTNSNIDIINSLHIKLSELNESFQIATLIKTINYVSEILNTYNSELIDYIDESKDEATYQLILDNKTTIDLTECVVKKVGLKWNDDEISWNNTKLVRKENSAPQNYNDGVVVLDNYELNKYSKEHFIDKGLEQNKTYYYKIYTFNKDGVATASIEDIILSLLPNKLENNVIITGIENVHQHNSDDEYSGIKISWNWNKSIEGIRILRSTNGFTENLENEIDFIEYNENITTYIDTDVNNGNIYYYCICAYDKDNNYNYDNKIFYKYIDEKAPVIDNVKDSIVPIALSPNKIKIMWNNTNCKDLKYVLLKRYIAGSEEEEIYKLYDNIGGEMLSYIDYRINGYFTKGVTYYYNLYAYDAAGNNVQYSEKNIIMNDMYQNLKKIDKNVFIKSYNENDVIQKTNINTNNILIKDQLDIKFRCYEDIIKLNWDNLEYYDTIHISLYEDEKYIGLLEVITKNEEGKFDYVEYVIDNDTIFIDNDKNNFNINKNKNYVIKVDYYKKDNIVDFENKNAEIINEDNKIKLKFDEFNFKNNHYEKMVITYSIDNPDNKYDLNYEIYSGDLCTSLEHINSDINLFLHDIYFNVFYVNDNGDILDNQYFSLNNNSNNVQLMDYYYDKNGNEIDKSNCNNIKFRLMDSSGSEKKYYTCSGLANKYAPTLKKINESYVDIDDENYYSINLNEIDDGQYKMAIYMDNSWGDVVKNWDNFNDISTVFRFNFKKNNFVLPQIDNIKNSIKAGINNDGFLQFKWNDNYVGIDNTIIYAYKNGEKIEIFNGDDNYYKGQYANLFKVINEYSYEILKEDGITEYEFVITDINNNGVSIIYSYIPNYILDSNIININYTIDKQLFNDGQIEISWEYPHNIVNFEKLNIQYGILDSNNKVTYKQLKVISEYINEDYYENGYIVNMGITKARFKIDENLNELNKLNLKYSIDYDGKSLDESLIIEDIIDYSDKWSPTNCGQASIEYFEDKNIIKFSLSDDKILHSCRVVRKEDSNPTSIYDGDSINDIYVIDEETFMDKNNEEIFIYTNETIDDLISKNINIARKGNTIIIIDDVESNKHYFYSLFVFKNKSVLNNGKVYDENSDLIYLNIETNETYTYYVYDTNILVYSHDNKVYINWKDAKFDEWDRIKITKKYNKDNFEAGNVIFDSKNENYSIDKYGINYFVDEEIFTINDRYLYVFETYDSDGNCGKILEYVDYNNITNII